MKDIRLAIILAVMLFTITLNAYAQEKVLTEDGKEWRQIIYYPSLPASNYEMESLKTNTAELIKNCWQVYDYKNDVQKKVAEVKVFDDKIEIYYNKRQTVVLNFTDVLDHIISLTKTEFVNNMVMYNPYLLRLGDVMFTFAPDGSVEAKKLADYLFYFQYVFREKRFISNFALFEPIAAQYRALKVKPPVSENMREFIVQANLFNQQKN